MSMQNLTTSANLQMFSKVLQDAVPSRAQQSPRTNASVSAGDVGEPQGKGQHGQLSAADLHQLMLSQLDQQFYLSQLAGLGSSDASVAPVARFVGFLFRWNQFTATLSVPRPLPPPLQWTGSTCAAGGSSGGMYGIDSTMSSADLLGQQLTHQKLMEQFLEVATTVAGEGGNNQQLSGGGTTPSAEEMMGGETHGQLTSHPQQLMGAGGGQQQQRTDGAQSPSSSQHQQQMPLSLLDQLQLLQMLGSSGANPSSVPGLAELLAAGGLSSSTSSENLAQLLKGVGGAGGSPNKAEQVYCELCDKWLCNRYFMKTHMLKKHGIGEATSSTNSPLKNGVGNFSFGTSAQFSADESTARSHSVSVQPPQMELASQRNESPPIGRLAPKLSLSSTPGVMGGGNVPGDTSTTTFNEALSPEHSQQMAVMQQLAAQLGLTNGGAGRAEGMRCLSKYSAVVADFIWLS
uniref:C2H2-type domain-containing protein n=1 Tax=Globodera rostochiensis TaxID=31243 RepID=A0A914HZ57_GLORO